MTQYSCSLCGGLAHVVRPRLRQSDAGLPGVTSDIKPWPRMGAILHCTACGHVQKRLDNQWQADVKAIYDDYVMYHLSGGTEQVVFDADGPSPRTSKLISGMLGTGAGVLPETGTLLDVGCGGGAFLVAFHKAKPGWALAGLDHCAQRRSEVLARPGVQAFYCGGLEQVDSRFDAVSMIYVLEHMPHPVAELAHARRLLKPHGALLVMVPDLAQSFFDFAVVDHCGHFFAETLTHAVELAGFEVVTLGSTWMAKEVGLIARPLESAPPSPEAQCGPALGRKLAQEGLNSLAATLAQARLAARQSREQNRPFGIFGTAIAGTWLCQALLPEEQADFFVDEDPQRWGRIHLGLPILSPAEAPAGATLFLVFPKALAQGIAMRLRARHPGLNLVFPKN